jgi:hypothetical protein
VERPRPPMPGAQVAKELGTPAVTPPPPLGERN